MPPPLHQPRPQATATIPYSRADLVALQLAGEAELYSRSLREYIPAAWHVVEPNTPYVPNWHIDVIAEHLQAQTEGQIQNLLINMPPRHMKSLSVGVFWPTWVWARNRGAVGKPVSGPGARWLFTSYDDSLATRDAVRSRTLLGSDWYKARWGGKFALTSDQNEKTFYTNDKGGERLTRTIGGAITGQGGDYLVCDDPHKITEAESELIRGGVVEFVGTAWYNRYNDPKTVRRTVVGQRAHVKDASAYVLDRGGWVWLCLPAEYERKVYSYGNPVPSPLGFKDPRTAEGELLWPTRLGPKEIEDERKGGVLYYATQWQQRPYPAGGGMFKVDRLRERVLSCRPIDRKHTVRGWDLAATEKKTSKRTAGVRMSRIVGNGWYCVEHVVLGKWTPDKRNEYMKAASARERDIKILFEHEGGSSGEDQALAIARLLVGNRVEAIKVTGDKVARADAVAAMVNLGNVWVVDDGTWDVEAFFQELEAFPNGEYKDQVDALSLAYNWLVRAAMGGTYDTVPEGPAGDWRNGPPNPTADLPPGVAERMPQQGATPGADPFADMGGGGSWRDKWPT